MQWWTDHVSCGCHRCKSKQLDNLLQLACARQTGGVSCPMWNRWIGGVYGSCFGGRGFVQWRVVRRWFGVRLRSLFLSALQRRSTPSLSYSFLVTHSCGFLMIRSETGFETCRRERRIFPMHTVLGLLRLTGQRTSGPRRTTNNGGQLSEKANQVTRFGKPMQATIQDPATVKKYRCLPSVRRPLII
jgi:hypothetical protein